MVTELLRLTKSQAFLDWQKLYKNILEKGILLYFDLFTTNGFCVKKFENDILRGT
jgi:hypothetical protein